MRELRYNSASEVLRVNFPSSWDPSALTGLTLTIKGRDGSVLLDAEDVTLWTPTTLDGAAAAFSTSITLDEITVPPEGEGEPTTVDPDSLSPGDLIMLVGPEGREIQTVKGYDATTFVVALDAILRNGYGDGNAVYGLWGSVEIDLSDTATYPAGKELTLVWTPTGTGAEFTELAVVSKYQQLETAGFESYLRDMRPRVWIGLKQPRDRLNTVVKEARSKVQNMLLDHDKTFVMERVRDQAILNPAIAAACAVLWMRDSDDELKEEKKSAMSDLTEEVGELCASQVWVDLEDDEIEGAGDKREHPHVFRKGW